MSLSSNLRCFIYVNSGLKIISVHRSAYISLINRLLTVLYSVQFRLFVGAAVPQKILFDLCGPLFKKLVSMLHGLVLQVDISYLQIILVSVFADNLRVHGP